MEYPVDFVRFKDNFRAYPDLTPLIGFFTFDYRRRERIVTEETCWEKFMETGFLVHHTSGVMLYTIAAIEICKKLEAMLT